MAGQKDVHPLLWAFITVLVALIGAGATVGVALINKAKPPVATQNTSPVVVANAPGKAVAAQAQTRPQPSATEAASKKGLPDPPTTVKESSPQGAKTVAEGRKEVSPLPKGTLEVTTGMPDRRHVKFMFVARDIGDDVTPLTDWLEKHQNVFNRKMKELGAEGQWNRTGRTWPPRMKDDTATFDVTFERHR